MNKLDLIIWIERQILSKKLRGTRKKRKNVKRGLIKLLGRVVK